MNISNGLKFCSPLLLYIDHSLCLHNNAHRRETIDIFRKIGKAIKSQKSEQNLSKNVYYIFINGWNFKSLVKTRTLNAGTSELIREETI